MSGCACVYVLLVSRWLSLPLSLSLHSVCLFSRTTLAAETALVQNRAPVVGSRSTTVPQSLRVMYRESQHYLSLIRFPTFGGHMRIRQIRLSSYPLSDLLTPKVRVRTRYHDRVSHAKGLGFRV